MGTASGTNRPLGGLSGWGGEGRGEEGREEGRGREEEGRGRGHEKQYRNECEITTTCPIHCTICWSLSMSANGGCMVCKQDVC